MDGGCVRSEQIVQCLSGLFLRSPRRFAGPIAQYDNDTLVAIEHDDLIADARQQLEWSKAKPAKDPNQFLVMDDSSCHINSRTR